jgi:hypothetical protein
MPGISRGGESPDSPRIFSQNYWRSPTALGSVDSGGVSEPGRRRKEPLEIGRVLNPKTEIGLQHYAARRFFTTPILFSSSSRSFFASPLGYS